MRVVNFEKIVKRAWQAYDASRRVVSVLDISARVSTNHVFSVKLENDDIVIAKLSYFGRYEHFVEDHSLINELFGKLLYRYQVFVV